MYMQFDEKHYPMVLIFVKYILNHYIYGMTHLCHVAWDYSNEISFTFLQCAFEF